MKIKKSTQHLTIVQERYYTTRTDYHERTYDIEVDDDRITDIHESTMIDLYNKLGKILNIPKVVQEEGGAL